ncbi:allophanate hydrolase [Humisphaera borealis]|uniref:Allophanate hydrolase n=1 Tax=Humisphaera borealis TaxID=2807512 RepID=A0A7M2WZ89_9BACT|nr:allophanate hydrolase [Humisphaera borealis]QOV90837.1 allophanate hydrolase [Humisphaera borealis]
MPATPSDAEVLTLGNLRAHLDDGTWSAASVIEATLRRIAKADRPEIWISRASEAQLAEAVEQIEARKAAGQSLPLFGVPVAVKDNIDVAGMPTTAACREYSYVPAKSATAVQKLQDAGAIVIGKTNLDQFATGLVGTRSPYGAVRNALDPKYISGGSSSGSAVAVALGLVPISLGTDTAGSGRVPAGFNNIVGIKPTRGLVSTRGVVPACRTLDCVSVFALSCDDARTVVKILGEFDPQDPFSRPVPPPIAKLSAKFRFGRPADAYLKFFGNAEYERAFKASIEAMKQIGGEEVTIDYGPFEAAARLLYEGPWVAERVAAIREFWTTKQDALHPVTRSIYANASKFDAVGTFEAMYKLAELRRASLAQWQNMDVLLLPTTGTTYTIDQVNADPVATNTNLGYYTNFVNLLDLAAIAVPASMLPSKLPFGITLMSPAGGDSMLCALGARLEKSLDLPIGATGSKATRDGVASASDEKAIVHVAVVGAHLSGLPLNYQLKNRGGQLVRATQTAPYYRLYALPGTTPPKPGMLRSPDKQSVGLAVEVWELSAAAFGEFVAEIPPPLGIGSVELEDGSAVKGFLCESYALMGAREITHMGGWRAYLAAQK